MQTPQFHKRYNRTLDLSRESKDKFFECTENVSKFINEITNFSSSL